MTVTELTGQGGVELGGSADVVFVHGSGPVLSNVVLEWDFDNDGDFSEPIEDITGFMVEAETLTGRDFPSQLTGRAGPGRLRLTLRNDDDRFSFFNAASPLNQDGNTLKIGRKIRVLTAEAVANDPVLLRRDRFNRPDGPLGATETNQSEASDNWLFSAGTNFGALSYAVKNNRCLALDDTETEQHAFVGTGGLDEYYTQVTIEQVSPVVNNYAGLIARRNTADNYVFLRVNTTQTTDGTGHTVQLGEVVSGVLSVLDSYSIPEGWPGMTIGLKSGPDDEVTGYIGGVPVLSATTGLSDATGLTGILYRWGNEVWRVEPPIVDNFHVFDDVWSETEGILWTGDVTKVRPRAPVSRDKVAEVDAEGQLARAALPDVVSPRAVSGAHTGLLVGDVLSKAGLLHPPGLIDEGTTTTGPVGIDDGKALELARKFEDAEFGFLHEMPEGAIAFQDRFARVGALVDATFSDAPGAQFGYTDLNPLDQRHDIVNRVTAGVTPDRPAGITVVGRGNSTAATVVNNVAVQMPDTVNTGDLIVVFIASTVGTSGVGWHVPIWWGVRRTFPGADDDSIRTRVYTRPGSPSMSGATFTFYTDSGGSGGNWIAHVYRIENWFEATQQGITDQIEFADGHNPPPVSPGWGRVPTLFFAINAGLTSVNGGEFVDLGEIKVPDGYSGAASLATFRDGAINGFDVALGTYYRFDTVEAENPTAFKILEGFAITESAVFAVRGFNGPHEVLPTLKNPNSFVASAGRFVTVDDVASQDELRTIRSLPDPPNLFATEDDAEGFAEAVLVTFKDDRPIFSMTFIASKSAAYRQQALLRRVGDKIRLVAEHSTGMGVNGDFFIESVRHHFSGGGTRWETTWELSPG